MEANPTETAAQEVLKVTEVTDGNGKDDKESAGEVKKEPCPTVETYKDAGGEDAGGNVEMGTEAADDKPTCPKEEETGSGCPEFFGVRSYLHTFYEAMSVKNPHLYEDIPDSEYLIGPRRRRRKSLWRKIILWIGINLLVFGTIVMVVAYAVPKRSVVVSQRDDTEIIDKTALSFNHNLNLSKIVGLVIFCVGGFIVVCILVCGLHMPEGPPYEDDLNEFQVRVAPLEEVPPLSPTEKKIPATEELASVQPKCSHAQEMMVMTNSGLCKVPSD